ncbi:protein serine/threonine phosphatase 2C [Dendrothele bispora CBS 962.96]|uniref:Protein serine/threonine phosphatase 2C n=1 Tax=Dendrothele bispora (strain CBS 962.96) TaxID=1314807 RepID=A0A4S8LXV5_DENBC|nr:protein serine/threonine phosphatase 2C [Dendrothele bispora CBS 962.96]
MSLLLSDADIEEMRKETDMGRPGSGPWPYTLLPEPRLSFELARRASARIVGDAHCVSFQPNGLPEYWNQDRYVVKDIDVPNLPGGGESEKWKLRAVFDGHLGHELVDHAASKLPILIQTALQAQGPSLSKYSFQRNNADEISSLLKQCIISFDESTLEDIMPFLPSPETLSSDGFSDEDIRSRVNRRHVVENVTDSNREKLLRCMQGATALIVLISPQSDGLWIANLGDCQAVLGVQNSSGEWETFPISSSHDCWNEGEVSRLKAEHPDESEVVLRHRVLGAMAVTRALGDYHYKLPRIYTDQVFLNIEPPGWPVEDYNWIQSLMERNLTPPYLSNSPDVRYLDLRSLQPTACGIESTNTNIGAEPEAKACLVMCSDGLVNLYNEADHWEPEELYKEWIRVVVDRPSNLSVDQSPDSNPIASIEANHALNLLRDALGGQDEDKVSRMITVEMEDRWMDDTTVVVEFL